MPITLDGSNGITTPMYNGSITANAVTPSVNMKNRIINGAMVIDQRNAGASVSSGFTVDRWNTSYSVASKFTAQQNAGSVTPPAGFTNYLGITSSSAYTVGAGENFAIQQPIEGYNVADLGWGTANAKTITLSFQVRSSLIGTFGGAILNSAQNRSYPFSYTISSANTWTSISVTIAGDTSGTWLTTNGVGMYVFFGLGVGSTYSGTAGSWAGTAYYSSTGATSVVGANGATFYITGVQLEVGSTATSFDYRPYGTELQLCQRYCQVFKSQSAYSFYGIGFNEGTTASDGTIVLKVTMRTAPSATFTAGSTFRSYSTQGYAATNIGLISGAMAEQVGVQLTISGATAGYGCLIQDGGSNNSSMTFTAEL